MSLFLVLIASVSLASSGDAKDRYLDCLLLVEKDIELGRRAAQIWADEGGGANAAHCLALADIAAGFGKLGAARLEEIAKRPDAGDNLARARLYAQASEAWLEVNEIENAATAIAAAFEYAPDATELHFTNARVKAANKDWHHVISAISKAEKADVVTAEGFILRGRARLEIGDTEGAAEDTVSALSLDPTNIDALTLRGDVQRAGVQIDVSLSTRR